MPTIEDNNGPGLPGIRLSDWRSYDAVADAYERVAAPRFEVAASHLLSLLAPEPGTRLLDLGTGTGAVPAAATAMGLALGNVVGCDLSSEMLARARRHMPGHVARANVVQLPFVTGSFDVATANCVLSHVMDHLSVLREVRRVISGQGRFAASSWGVASDAYTTAWRELLERTIGAGAVGSAVEAVAPLESRLSSEENVRAALLEGGFDRVRVTSVTLSFRHSVEEYVADRALGSSGRLGLDRLGPSGWSRFLATAESEFHERFGVTVSYERTLVLAVARRT